nr:PA14 domain-containing protein [Micromonospora sp. DSM 115978]
AQASVSYEGATGTPPPACPPTQWVAAYYPNLTLSDTPPTVCEDELAHDWGEGAPGVGSIGADNFSVRWTRSDTFEAGPATFVARADDGIRVYLDDVLVIDEWRDQGATTFTASVPVTAGSHEITVEYYDSGYAAEASLIYSGEPPPPPSCPTTEWAATYFPNQDLAGLPAAQQ